MENQVSLDIISLLPKGQFTPLEDITFAGLISAFINIALVVAAILFVFSLFFAGIKLIVSGGEKERTDEAKRQLVNALIGIVIVFSSWAAISFLGTFFGLDLTTFEIPAAGT